MEVELETQGKQGAYSDLSAMSNLKAKSEFNTENLLERIVDKRNIYEAYKKVVANKGSHEVDEMKVDELLPFLQEHYESLKARLLSGKYKPQPVRRVEIPKPNGGIRLLGIPTVVDRLIQQAIYQVSKFYNLKTLILLISTITKKGFHPINIEYVKWHQNKKRWG